MAIATATRKVRPHKRVMDTRPCPSKVCPVRNNAWLLFYKPEDKPLPPLQIGPCLSFATTAGRVLAWPAHMLIPIRLERLKKCDQPSYDERPHLDFLGKKI